MVDHIVEKIKISRSENHISGDEFKKIAESKSDRMVAFVDAGNAELFKGPGFCLHFFRVHYCIYEKGEK